jgi:hypothetical protein
MTEILDALRSLPIPAATGPASSLPCQAELTGQIKRIAQQAASAPEGEGGWRCIRSQEVTAASRGDFTAIMVGADRILVHGNPADVLNLRGQVSGYGFAGATWSVPDSVLQAWTERLVSQRSFQVADAASVQGGSLSVPAAPAAVESAAPAEAPPAPAASPVSPSDEGTVIFAENPDDESTQIINQLGGSGDELLQMADRIGAASDLMSTEGLASMLDALKSGVSPDAILRAAEGGHAVPSAPLAGTGPVTGSAPQEGLPAQQQDGPVPPADEYVKPVREKSKTGLLTAEQQAELDAALAELDALVGLDEIKDKIRRQTAMLKIRLLREKAGKENADISGHMVFTGNPGTGKTTVARIMGKIYHALGVLSKGHVVEVDRGGLVAEFSGQTPGKTLAVAKSALGGVLFIDEAYTINTSSSGSSDPYGEEASQTLMKFMEDHRDDFIVILAGYTGAMARMLSTNVGWKSRIATQIDFANFTPEQLAEIYCRMASGSDYAVPNDTRARVQEIAQLMVDLADEHFGNARTIRDLFEKTLEAQAERVVALPDAKDGTVADEILMNLLVEDVDAANKECDGFDERDMLARVQAGEDIKDIEAELHGDASEAAAAESEEAAGSAEQTADSEAAQPAADEAQPAAS